MNVREALSSPVCMRVALTFLHFLWQGLAIALLATAAAKVFGARSARLRYAVHVAALGAMVLAVVVTYAVVQPPAAHRAPRPTASTDASLPGETARTLEVDLVAAAPIETTVADAPAHKSATPARFSLGWLQATPYALGAYFAGVLLMLARLLVGLHGGGRLRRRSQPLDDLTILRALARQARALGLSMTPAIAYCSRVVVPTVVGVLRPVILLPFSFASGLAREQVEALLAHELAHIRRLDPLVNVMQRVVEAFLFFHPAVWFVSHRIRVERELCCDDLVISTGASASTYASSLVETAKRGLAAGTRLRLAPQGLGLADRPSRLRARIQRLLGHRGHESVRAKSTWAPGLLAAAVVGLVAFALLAGSFAGEGAGSPGDSEADEQPAAQKAPEEPPPDEILALLKQGAVGGLGVAVEMELLLVELPRDTFERILSETAPDVGDPWANAVILDAEHGKALRTAVVSECKRDPQCKIHGAPRMTTRSSSSAAIEVVDEDDDGAIRSGIRFACTPIVSADRESIALVLHSRTVAGESLGSIRFGDLEFTQPSSGQGALMAVYRVPTGGVLVIEGRPKDVSQEGNVCVALVTAQVVGKVQDFSATLKRWEQLAQQRGCLVGAQDWHPKGPGEGSCLREEPWRTFLAETPREFAEVLFELFGSEEETNIHVCPFYNATKGELAVYTVQHLLKLNWTDYDGNNEAIIAAAGEEREQTALRRVLADEEAREDLRRFFDQQLRIGEHKGEEARIPLRVTSDRLERRGQNTTVFTGNAVARDGTNTIWADTIVAAHYSDEETQADPTKRGPKHLRCTGHVRIARRTEQAKCELAEYDVTGNTITCKSTENARVSYRKKDGPDELQLLADTVILDRNAGGKTRFSGNIEMQEFSTTSQGFFESETEGDSDAPRWAASTETEETPAAKAAEERILIDDPWFGELETAIFRVSTRNSRIVEDAQGKRRVTEIEEMISRPGLVTWPEGSSIVYDEAASTLTVTNTRINMIAIREGVRVWKALQRAPEPDASGELSAEEFETAIFDLSTSGIRTTVDAEGKPREERIDEQLRRAEGVTWPVGSSVHYHKPSGKLIATNTPENMKLIRELVRAWDEPKGDAAAEAAVEDADRGAARRRILEKLDGVVPEVDFKDAELKEVVGFLSKETGVNIVFGPKALELLEDPSRPTTITIKLKNTPLKDVLTYVLRFKGLKYVVDDNAVVIVPVEPPPAERPEMGEFETQIFRLSGNGTYTTVDAEGNPAEQSIDERLRQAPGLVWPAGSNIEFHKLSGTLIVTNTAENMAVIRELVKAWDTPPADLDDETNLEFDIQTVRLDPAAYARIKQTVLGERDDWRKPSLVLDADEASALTSAVSADPFCERTYTIMIAPITSGETYRGSISDPDNEGAVLYEVACTPTVLPDGKGFELVLHPEMAEGEFGCLFHIDAGALAPLDGGEKGHQAIYHLEHGATVLLEGVEKREDGLIDVALMYVRVFDMDALREAQQALED